MVQILIRNSEVFIVCAQIEQEIAELDEEEKQMFLEELGINQSGLTGCSRRFGAFGDGPGFYLFRSSSEITEQTEKFIAGSDDAVQTRLVDAQRLCGTRRRYYVVPLQCVSNGSDICSISSLLNLCANDKYFRIFFAGKSFYLLYIGIAVGQVDIAGLVRGASKGEGLGNQFLAHIREVDAIVHVVRCFDDSNVIHVNSVLFPTFGKPTIPNFITMNLPLFQNIFILTVSFIIGARGRRNCTCSTLF